MKLIVNGKALEAGAETLAELLVELDYVGRRYVTALNSEFVPHAERADRSLAEGDRVEILAPMQGG